MVLLAFVLRALNLTGESLWRDEIDTVRFAFGSSREMLSNLTRNGFNGPLYHLLMRGWLTLGGVNDFTLRYFSLLCGVAEVALVYALAHRLFGRRAAVLAAWFTAIAPVLIWYSGEGKMYTLQPALIVLALYALRRAVSERSGIRDWRLGTRAQSQSLISNLQSLRDGVNAWWVVFVAAVSLGYYVHLLTPLFLAVAVVFFVLWWPLSRRHLLGGVIAIAACTLPYVPLALWQLPSFMAGASTGHVFIPLDLTVFALLFNWSLGLSDQLPPDFPPEFTWFAILLFAGVVILGVVSTLWEDAADGIREPWCRFASAAGMLMWMLLPAVLVFVISTRAPVFEPRYLLWAAPASYILIGVGLAWLLSRVNIIGVALTVLLSLISVRGVVAQVAYPIRPDVRGAAQAAAAGMQPADLFVFQIPYTRYGFEYYLPSFAAHLPLDETPRPDDGLRTIQGLRERIVDAPFTNNDAPPGDVDAQLELLANRSSRIWLVEAEAPMWDERGLVRAWFDEHMVLAERHDLRGISVGLYKKP
jgi:uncharacterized membrane protein